MANNATRELPTAGDFSPLGYVSWMMDYHAIHGHDIASFDTSGTRKSRPARDIALFVCVKLMIV